MTWADWMVVAIFLLSTAFNIRDIGKERKPITPSDAVVTFTVALAIIGCILFAHS